MTHLPVWYIGKINPALCDIARDELMRMPPRDAAMGSSGETKDEAGRKTEVRFASEGFWFGGVMAEFAYQANKACGWNYNIDGHENLQLGRYMDDGHYDWHVDNFPLEVSEKERKVSVVCLLSDPAEYEGGRFGIKLYNEYNPELEKGSIIAFPSSLEHKVYPVTSGVRTSAVIWMTGPQMR
jgi:PKHD-type hydroxylase